MIEALSYSFMQNAVLAAILAAVACGVIGALVVVNRLVFMAGGMAHAAYGGVGLAFYFGLPVLPCAVGFTLAASGIMGGLTLRGAERSDTVIGVLWAAGMAFGVLLVDITPGYNADLMSYLFGSILTVSRVDLWAMAGLDVVILGLAWFYYDELLACSFDPEYARTTGAPVAALHFLLLALTAVSVVMVIQVVGLILVIALLTIPPYLAERRSSSLSGMMLRATAWSLAFCLAGLAAAYTLNVSSGASIIAVAAMTFFVVQGGSILVSKVKRR